VTNKVSNKPSPDKRRCYLREWFDREWEDWPANEPVRVSRCPNLMFGDIWDLGHDWNRYPGLRYLYEVRGGRMFGYIDPLPNTDERPTPRNLMAHGDGWYFMPWHDLLVLPGVAGPFPSRAAAEAGWRQSCHIHNQCIERVIAEAAIEIDEKGSRFELCREPLLALLEKAGEIASEQYGQWAAEYLQ
jgi:hypothetical protein